MVRPLISGLSSTLEVVGTAPLDTDEKESGATAWSAFLYQYGAELDAKWLVLMWAAGVASPRLAQLAKDKATKKVTEKTIEDARAKQAVASVTNG